MDSITGTWSKLTEALRGGLRAFVSARDWTVRDALAWRLRALAPSAEIVTSAWSGVNDHGYDDVCAEILLQPGTAGLDGERRSMRVGLSAQAAPIGSASGGAGNAAALPSGDGPRAVRLFLAESGAPLKSRKLAPAADTAARTLLVSGWREAPERIDAALADVLEDILGEDPAEAAQAVGRFGLTPRQVEVLNLVAEGQSNADIAAGLGMSENTVRIHVSAILRALGLSNRTQAALWALQIGRGGKLSS